MNISRYENIIAYDGSYEDGQFIPLDKMPPHKGRHRAILLLKLVEIGVRYDLLS